MNMSDEDKQQIALHKAEVKELQRQYDRDLKLQDFLSIKGLCCLWDQINMYSELLENISIVETLYIYITYFSNLT